MIDSTIVRRISTAQALKGDSRPGSPWRSKGGLTTKIHTAVDALGNPVRFILTGGQDSDYTQALPLIEGFAVQAILADKGYDSDEIVRQITASAFWKSGVKFSIFLDDEVDFTG